MASLGRYQYPSVLNHSSSWASWLELSQGRLMQTCGHSPVVPSQLPYMQLALLIYFTCSAVNFLFVCLFVSPGIAFPKHSGPWGLRSQPWSCRHSAQHVSALVFPVWSQLLRLGLVPFTGAWLSGAFTRTTVKSTAKISAEGFGGRMQEKLKIRCNYWIFQVRKGADSGSENPPKHSLKECLLTSYYTPGTKG